MANITLKGNSINTSGTLPSVGTTLPEATLVASDLSEVQLSSIKGKKILNVFPSIDTSVCSLSYKNFKDKLAKLKGKSDVSLLNISKDTPFALGREAGEPAEKVMLLSAFRSSFAEDFGLKIVDGPLRELCSRAVIVVGANNEVLYTEQVPEITQEPNYESAVDALK